MSGLLPKNPRPSPPPVFLRFFLENGPLMRETNFTLGPIQKSLYLLLLYQFTFAQNRPKSDITGANTLHYITLKAFAMASGDGTKCKTCFGGPRMALCGPWKRNLFFLFKNRVWFPVWQKTTLSREIFCATSPIIPPEACFLRSLT